MAGLGLVAMILAGCRKASPVQPPPAPLQVLATTYPLAAMAREVGGPGVQVQWLAERGQSLDEIIPTDELRSRIQRADLVLAVGGPDRWATTGSDDPFTRTRVLRVDFIAPDPQNRAQAARWLEPPVAKQLIAEMARRFSERRPRQEADFIARAEALIRNMDQLLQQHQAKLATLEGRKALVLGEEFNGLLLWAGVQPLNPFNSSALRLEPTQIHQLRALQQEGAAEVLVVSADTPAAVLTDLAQRTGLRVIRLDATGAATAADRDEVLELLEHNLSQLLSAWPTPSGTAVP